MYNLDAKNAFSGPFLLDRRQAIDRVSVEDNVQVGEQGERADRHQKDKELNEASEGPGKAAGIHERQPVEQGVEQAIAHLNDCLLRIIGVVVGRGCSCCGCGCCRGCCGRCLGIQLRSA